jgi:hypothetical protein
MSRIILSAELSPSIADLVLSYLDEPNTHPKFGNIIE